MEARIHDYQVTILGGAERSPAANICQINLFERGGDTIGFLKFIAEEADTREHQCGTQQITVYYRQSQAESVLALLADKKKRVYVFCNGAQNSGIRGETRKGKRK